MYHLIVNPSSRSGSHAGVREQLEQMLRQRDIPYCCHQSAAPGDAGRLAAQVTSADGPDTPDSPEVIVIMGGDGTINEVINGIQDFRKCRIGIVPAGSGNDFARGLMLPKDPEAVLRRIVQGQVRRTIDLGRVTFHSTGARRSRLHDSADDAPQEAKLQDRQRLFCVSAGIGLDAAICEEALVSPVKDLFNRIRLGKLTYGMIGLRQVVTCPKIRAEAELPDGSTLRTDRMFFCAFMNEAFEGGGYRFAPDASDTDGRLNLVLVGDMAVPKALLSFPAAHAGKCYAVKGVRHISVRKVRIRTAEPLWVHTDGEVSFQSDDITVECLPGCLPLIV